MKIRNAGKYGVIQDLEPWELPPEAWSAGQNVRAVDGSMEKFLGCSSTGLGTPTAKPAALLAYRNSTNYYWLYAAGAASTITDIHVTDGMTHKEITNVSADYTGGLDDVWTGLVFGGIPIFNNGVDAPQSWDGDFSAGNRCTDLANWPSSTECGSMRGFKQFLIAMNITKSSTEYPRMVKWSHAAGSNAVPTSWDETDAALDAGEFELQDSTGKIIDGLAGGEIFYLYKDDSIWGMQYIGAPLIWRFFKISSQIGIVAKRCVVDTPIGHIVFGSDDLILVSGGTVRSLTDRKNRNAIFNEVDTDNFRRAFVVHNWADSEVWFCYPTTSGNGTCDKAFVLNYIDASSGFRNLPNVMDIKFDIADPVAAAGAGDSWDADSDTWDSDITDWGEVLFSAVSRKLVGAGHTSAKLYIFNDTNQEDGTNMTSFVERTGIGSEDQTMVKHTSQLFPIMESSGPVNIQVGSQFSSDEAIDWSSAVAFDPNTDHKVDIRKTGRLFALKIESTADISWRLYGYNMPMKVVGNQ